MGHRKPNGSHLPYQFRSEYCSKTSFSPFCFTPWRSLNQKFLNFTVLLFSLSGHLVLVISCLKSGFASSYCHLVPWLNPQKGCSIAKHAVPFTPFLLFLLEVSHIFHTSRTLVLVLQWQVATLPRLDVFCRAFCWTAAAEMPSLSVESIPKHATSRNMKVQN